MRIKNIAGIKIPDTARPGDEFTFTGKLTITVQGIHAELIDVTSMGGEPRLTTGDAYAEIIGTFTERQEEDA